MAYEVLATAVSLNDIEGHSPVAGLFKCNPSNTCAAFYTISTDSVLARFLCFSSCLFTCYACILGLLFVIIVQRWPQEWQRALCSQRHTVLLVLVCLAIEYPASVKFFGCTLHIYITWLNICMSKSNLIGISSLYSVLSKSLNGQPIYTIVYRNTGSGQHISSYVITFPTGLL